MRRRSLTKDMELSVQDSKFACQPTKCWSLTLRLHTSGTGSRANLSQHRSWLILPHFLLQISRRPNTWGTSCPLFLLILTPRPWLDICNCWKEERRTPKRLRTRVRPADPHMQGEWEQQLLSSQGCTSHLDITSSHNPNSRMISEDDISVQLWSLVPFPNTTLLGIKTPTTSTLSIQSPPPTRYTASPGTVAFKF